MRGNDNRHPGQDLLRMTRKFSANQGKRAGCKGQMVCFWLDRCTLEFCTLEFDISSRKVVDADVQTENEVSPTLIVEFDINSRKMGEW